MGVHRPPGVLRTRRPLFGSQVPDKGRESLPEAVGCTGTGWGNAQHRTGVEPARRRPSVARVVGCPARDPEPRKPPQTQSEASTVKAPHSLTEGPAHEHACTCCFTRMHSRGRGEAVRDMNSPTARAGGNSGGGHTGPGCLSHRTPKPSPPQRKPHVPQDGGIPPPPPTPQPPTRSAPA